MFSATWPEEIRSLADKFLRKDVLRVVVGGEELSANHKVKQIVECVVAYEKDKKLLQLLESYHKGRKNRFSSPLSSLIIVLHSYILTHLLS
jgi:ATP-dependent RNA helicase DBP3